MTVKAILDQKGREVITVTPEISLSDANAKLAEYKIGAVVVVDNANRICGILSERDIVRGLAGGGEGQGALFRFAHRVSLSAMSGACGMTPISWRAVVISMMRTSARGLSRRIAALISSSPQ